MRNAHACAQAGYSVFELRGVVAHKNYESNKDVPSASNKTTFSTRFSRDLPTTAFGFSTTLNNFFTDVNVTFSPQSTLPITTYYGINIKKRNTA